MAWASPATAVTGDVITAAFGNTNGRDNLNALVASIPDVWGQIQPPEPSYVDTNAGANVALIVAMEPVLAVMTITQIRIQIPTSSGNIDVGIYSRSGTTYTRRVSLGATASPGTGTRSLNIADTALVPGLPYYLAFAADNGTVTLRCYQTNTGIMQLGGLGQSKATSYPLPSSIAAPSAATIAPLMAGLVSGSGVA